MQLATPLPLLHFVPTLRERHRRCTDAYACPMYVYPVRTGTRERPSMVCMIDLPSGAAGPHHWTLRGTALLLSLSS